MTQTILFRETIPVAELADQAISAVVDGDVDPIYAHISVSRIEAAIKRFKENERVRDIILFELSKYGKKQTFGDCILEEYECGVKYDYSLCNDSKLAAMYATLEDLKADIKERELTLRNLPASGMVDPDSGEVVYPPAKSSKTTIKTVFKRI